MRRTLPPADRDRAAETVALLAALVHADATRDHPTAAQIMRDLDARGVHVTLSLSHTPDGQEAAQ